MKISKKLVSLLLSIVMLIGVFSVGVAASAATPAAKTIKAYPGQTVTIELSEQLCYGISGDISYSNRELFSSVTPGSSPIGQIREKKFILSSADPNECKVTLSVKVSDTATAGSKSVVTFTYLRVDDPVTQDGPDGLVKTVTVEVIQKQESSSSSTVNPPVGPDKDESSSSPAQSTPVVPNNPTTPTNPNNLDIAELNKQISIAQGLKEKDYTSDSWKAMKNALNAAINARNASTQNQVDTAAKNLQNAIAALVRVDNTSLQGLIDTVKNYLAEESLTDLREALLEALADAEAAMKAGKQDGINDAFAKLNAAFEAYKAKVNELGKGEIVEVEKPVEVAPSGPYCNIWVHTLWWILLIVSLAVNAVFIVLTVRYFARKKKNAKDDTPLVDYNIDED